MRLTPTPDGGLIISGRGTAGLNIRAKVILFKVDSSGSFLWGLRSNDVDKLIFSGDSFLAPDGGDIFLGGRA